MNKPTLFRGGSIIAAIVTLGFLAQASHATQPDPLVYAVAGRMPTATIGEAYNFTFCDPDPGASGLCGKTLASNPTATPEPINPHGGTPPYTFTVKGTGLPLGLALHTNGNITGTPAQNTPTGVRKFTVCVSDAVGQSTCKSESVTVKLIPLKYTFPSKMDDATIGKSYKYVFCRPDPGKGKFCGKVLPKASPTNNPTGGTPPYTFKVSGVGLPFGLAMNLNGTVSGTPKSYTPTGKQMVNVCVTDLAGKSVCKKVAITVRPKPPTVSITAPTEGQAVDSPVTMTATARVAASEKKVRVTSAAIASVTFLVDDCIGKTTCAGNVDTTSPYSVTNTLSAGTHRVQARAVASNGGVGLSSIVTFTVKAKASATVDTVTCTFDHSEPNGSETINYFNFSASGTATGVENQTEVKPYLSTSTATYNQSDTIQSSGGSWTVEDPDYSAFRRGIGEPATTTWTYSEQIYIISGSDWVWPGGTDKNQMAAHLIEYDGDNFARGALDTVYKDVPCAQP